MVAPQLRFTLGLAIKNLPIWSHLKIAAPAGGFLRVLIKQQTHLINKLEVNLIATLVLKVGGDE